MADGSRRKAAQPAHSTNILAFGHFGTATYDKEISRWSFLRVTPDDSVQIGDEEIKQPSFRLIKISTQGPTGPENPDVPTEDPKQVSAIRFLKNLPEAVSSACDYENDLVPRSLPDSRASLDPTLITFASALMFGNEDIQSGFQTAPVTVRVHSGQLNTLTMTPVSSEVVSVEMNRVQRMQFPCISEDDQATWCSKRGSIMQIRASARSSSQEATWLAIRQTTATTIFQLLLHRTSAKSSDKSPLDFNLLVELPISRTGGLQHADVIFHPQDPHTLAIVDIAGNWSIWTITGSRSRSTRILYRVQLASYGSCAPRSRKPILDDWHRIAWLSNGAQNVYYLLVANRQSLFLFDMKGSLISEKEVCIGNRGQGWILDILLAPSAAADFLVITTTHIFWMNTDALADNMSRPTDPSQGPVIACWKHFYDYNHMNQNLNAIWFSKAIWLFAASTNNQITTAYRCARSENASADWSQVFDPLSLNIPLSHTNGMRCLSVQLIKSGIHSTGQDMSNSRLFFFKAFYQKADGSIYELLCLLSDPDAGSPLDMIPLPKRQPLQYKSAFRVSQMDEEESISDFIASDDESDSNNDAKIGVITELTSQIPEVTSNVLTGAGQLRTCNMQTTYDSVALQIHLFGTKKESIDENIVESIQVLMDEGVTTQTLSELVSDAASDNIHVVDIENDSQMLERWLQELGQAESEPELGNLTKTRVDRDQSLIEIYEELVDRWMFPLSEEVSNRFRVQRERLLRQAALDVYFSSVLIRSSIKKSTQHTEETRDQSDPTTLALSLRMSQLDTHSEPTSPSLASSQTLAEQLEASTPSLLSQYVTFKKPSGTTKKASATVNNIMAHLPPSPDIDPVTYNFNDVELNLALATNELATQDMDAKSRRKAEKLAKARKKQLEKQAQWRKAAFDQANALPTIMSSQLPIREIQSSQGGPVGSSQPSITNVSQVNMTQPERGAFGRRETKKAKGKGRQKGF